MIIFVKNKNENNHKSETQEIRQSRVDRVAANMIEYHIMSNLIFLHLEIPKFMMKRQLFHVRNVCKNVRNPNV